MSLAPLTVTGARISLVPLACDDANDIYRLCQDPAIMQWTTVPSPYSRDQAREFVEKVATAGWEKNEPHWAIRTVATNTLVGTLSMRIQSEDGTLDVGYWVGADSRGSGYATEALILAARVAFDTLNAPRLVWRSRVGNWPSWRVAWRLGFHAGKRGRQVENDKGEEIWEAFLEPDDTMEPAAPWDGPAAPAPVMGRRSGTSHTPGRSTRSPQELVSEFHSTYHMPNRVADGGEPTLDYDRVMMRMSLIAEEFSELIGAMWGPDARTLIEQAYQQAAEGDHATSDIVETADALADLVYVIYGMALESGIDLDAVLEEVQASNLSKLMPDGSVKRREDGKVLKGPNFFPPNIARVLHLDD